MVRRMILFLTLALLCLVLALGAYIRLAPSEPAVWHVDPGTAPDPATPNFSRVDRVVSLPADAVAAAIRAAAEGDGATLLAGTLGAEPRHATWIARTKLMRYPDYVSIRLIPEGAGTRIIALSRSRFGHGDLGVNGERLQRWLPE